MHQPQAVVIRCVLHNPAGTLPPALGFCKDLLYLDLSGHSLSGELPALPPSIQFLNVSSNGLSGSLPEFAVDAQLQYLDLSFNRWG
jgi:Leucine-rich repeat (LRR) protein